MADVRPGPAEFQAAGLYDPDAPDAAARLALLDFLASIGATVDDMLAEVPEELPILASTISLWPDRERLTVAEMARRADADPRAVMRVWRAAGFAEPEPDARVMTTLDVELFQALELAVQFFGEEAIVQFVRVLGAATQRVADAAISAFVVNVGPAMIEEDPSGLALAQANATSSSMLAALVQAFDVLLRHNLESERRPIDVDVQRGVEMQRRSIGFVDLVGSTALAEELEIGELSAALTAFDATASDIVAERGGRVIKLIGDAVMFVAAEPSAGCDIALALVDAFASHHVLPPVRGAVATGDVVARAGDYSGSVVNLAARAAKIAAVSNIVVDAATRDALRSGFVTADAGAHKMKGLGDSVRLFRVSRAG